MFRTTTILNLVRLKQVVRVISVSDKGSQLYIVITFDFKWYIAHLILKNRNQTFLETCSGVLLEPISRFLFTLILVK